MDEETAQHGLDPEVQPGNKTMPNSICRHENWKNQSPTKADTLSGKRRVQEHNLTGRQFLLRNLLGLLHCSSHTIHSFSLAIDKHCYKMIIIAIVITRACIYF